MRKLTAITLAAVLGLFLAGKAMADDVDVVDHIDESTTWTSDNVYNLTQRIYVLPGATLTIEPGTLVQTDHTSPGALAVCRGAKIYVNGTKDEPVIMTSDLDTLNAWHEGCEEWGGLAVMGEALISGSHYDDLPQSYQDGYDADVHDNTKLPDGMNKRTMEGLIADDVGDPKVLYGGDNDDDDSGGIHYVSIRYAGKVIGWANELNGLSMGGIGRETDVDHVEIMNNVDDGIETWGGTVNYKYVAMWNVGDDSFDFDQGWRGRAQFGLIVQGYSQEASQGSGVGDNCFETDGAEDSDAQPCTTAQVYNFTVIGQPHANGGDNATAWRDGARVQYRNCVFMDIGEKLVKFDNDDGDGADGYGAPDGPYNTLSWDDVWTMDYDYIFDPSNAKNLNYLPGDTIASVQARYPVQTDGKLAEITDSVFYNITGGLGDAPVDLSDAQYNNVVEPANSPIESITRDVEVTRGGKQLRRVIGLDPRARNDAATSVGTAPDNGFYTPVQYRGGFSPDVNWLLGWTASDAYGWHAGQTNPDDPAATIKMTTSTSFDTEAGALYTVEQSTDMHSWYPIGTVTGTGETMSVTDLADFDNAKYYRVVRQ